MVGDGAAFTDVDRKGEAVPPLDLRYLRKGVPTKGNDGGDGTRGRVVTFLSTIYESVAETLPDARDEPRDQEDGDEYMTVTLPQAEPDPYATAMNDSQMFQKLNPKRGKSLRSVRLGVRMNSA
ncbi:FO synthase subunit 1, partial [Durusdinium trenchii]